ncbi:glycosyltransferase, partial [Patescibacteria group bacterium]|nr:glycosyltransferase [Patescibacteria group bacterium]
MNRIKTPPLVSICCITYNHEKYIEEAIESFLMQKVNFPIEIIIHDDASTDGTQEIIKKYTNRDKRIVPVLRQENIKSTGVIMMPIVLKYARGKYVAICEGDDFWTDPYKLQKQFDLMEDNPEYSACCHAVQKSYYKNKKASGVYRQAKKDKVFLPEEWFKLTSMQTSLFFRREYINKLPDWVVNAPIGGVVLRLFLSQQGKFAYINQIMSSYRVEVPNGWTQQIRTNPFKDYNYNKGMVKMYDEFDKYTNYKYSEIINLKQLILLLSQ